MTSTQSSPTPGPEGASSWRAVWEGVQDGGRVVVPTPDGVVVCLSEDTYIQLLARAEPQLSPMNAPERLIPRLTKRELQVMRAVQAGGTGPQIAGQMGVADNTIAQHLHSVRAKYGVSSTARALLAAERDGLL